VPLVAADLELVAVLLLLTSLEGARRVQAGTIIFRRTLLGPWQAQDPIPRTRWGLPAPLTPLVMAIGASGESATLAPNPHAMFAQYHSTIQPVRVLRVLGIAQLMALLIGIPLGAGRWSGAGFLTALALTLFLSVVIALVARRALAHLPAAEGRGIGTWLSLLNPFSAASAAQTVLQEALRSGPPAYVAHLLLPCAAFRAWVRPLVYDVLQGAEHAAVSALLGEAEMRALVDQPPEAEADAASYCRRCGVASRRQEGECSSCRIALSPMPPR
jgi:hypothetical protein